jgi:hypothetical protein
LIRFISLIQVPAGLVTLGFILVQLVTGPRWIKGKLRLTIHRVSGFVAIGTGVIHGAIGIYLRFFL